MRPDTNKNLLLLSRCKCLSSESNKVGWDLGISGARYQLQVVKRGLSQVLFIVEKPKDGQHWQYEEDNKDQNRRFDFYVFLGCDVDGDG